jgi:peptide-methionine (S)-S-oxide reductase
MTAGSLADWLLLLVTLGGVVAGAEALHTWKKQLLGTSRHQVAQDIASQRPTIDPCQGALMRNHPTTLLLILGFMAIRGAIAAETMVEVPAWQGIAKEAPAATTQTALLAGGCFWGVQAVFQHLKGVTRAVSGYAGGEAATAEYELVGSGQTGHAETVQVTFDPRVVSYAHLLQVYFSVAHDPTQLNRQGPDRGTQYRSAVFPVDGEQARIARDYIAQLNRARVFRPAIVTQIEPGKTFYPAEDYHQDFLANNPTYPYIVINDLPKVEGLKHYFPADYRADPVLVLVHAAKRK